LSLIPKFLNHGGYYGCFCYYTKGYHDRQCKKRQYPLTQSLNICDLKTFEIYVKRAEDTGETVYGHVGRSKLAEILDVPLSIYILYDYQHVKLLRHIRDVVKALNCSLSSDIRNTDHERINSKCYYFSNFQRNTFRRNVFRPVFLRLIILRRIVHSTNSYFPNKNCSSSSFSSFTRFLVRKLQ